MASTPLPPDDGENNHVAELPTGFRLIDVEQLAAQQRDGVAENPPGVSASVAPNDGDSNHALPTGLRLVDVEQLAAQQRDGVAEDLPGVSASVAPNDGDSNDALPTGVRLGNAERIALERLDGAAEGSLKEALAIVPPPAVASLVERIELVGDSLAAEPVAPLSEATPVAEASEQAPVGGQQPEPVAAAATDSRDPIIPVEGIAAPSRPAADVSEAEPAAEAAPVVPAADTLPVGVAAPVREGAAPDNVRPLASALDAAAKLAADANAAAEALENLKRLLERQLPNVAANHAPQAAAEPTEAIARTPATVAVVQAAPPQPPSLPLHAVRDGSGRSTLRPAVLAPLPTPRARPERVRLDVRGFLAGFALSWAFGVVLYLFMTSG